MSAELPLTFSLPQRRATSRAFADTALKASARFWFVLAAIGQLLFAFATASFYFLTALRGDMHRWTRFLGHAPASGNGVGYFAASTHLISAVIIIVAGIAQLIPQIRERFPRFHRWNGRIYMLTVVTATVAGLYMLWFRSGAPDLSQRIGATVNAVLIWICAVLAVRYAVARNFKTHRRWALRLFLVVNGGWFFRVGLFLSFVIFKGPVGFDPSTFTGPFLSVLVFAEYLVPLAVLQFYFYAQDHAGAARRLVTAAVLFVLTLGMGTGIFAVTMAVWVPHVAAGFDSRTSIAQTLSEAIAARGIEQATSLYRQLKATKSAAYNFEEGELNSLGYQLIRNKQVAEAIRIFELNAAAYPRSSNVYDSLGEAHAAAGNKLLAITNYQKAVELDANNRDALAALARLGVPAARPR